MASTRARDTFTSREDIALALNEIPVDDRPIKFDRMMAKSSAMKRVFRRIILAAGTNVPVLVQGETGTGKDLVAESIHRRGLRRNGPFISLNIGAVPRERISGELFGVETHQDRRPGRLEMAEGGTLFLDEITSMDVSTQTAFLRVLERGEYSRVGGARPIACNVRVIAATNADLAKLAHRGRFRRGLMFKLEVFPIRLPPLRERPGAIRLLCEEFQKSYRSTYHLPVKGFDTEAIRLLERYEWPGNVRELKNVIQRAVLVCRRGPVTAAHLPERVVHQATGVTPFTFSIGRSLGDLEREYARRTLAHVNGNKAKAARLLRISRKTLYGMLARR